MLLKQSDIIYFNVDEIEIYGTFANYDKLMVWLDDDNSNIMFFEEFTLQKLEGIKDYEYKINFIYNSIPCFAFYVGTKVNEYITTRNYFKVHWSAFQIFELETIIDFINTYLLLDMVDKKKNKKAHTMKRFDLAVDVLFPVDFIVNKNFKKLNQKGTRYMGTKWELETYYIWAYKVRDNKNFLIRVYDKIKDIKLKRKQRLYPWYLEKDNITRIEIEFRSQVVSFLDFEDLLDTEKMFNLFIMYIKKHTKIFKNLKTQDVDKLKRINKYVDIEQLKYDRILRERYFNTYCGYSKNILEMWACPVDILIRNDFISDLTRRDIAKCIVWEELSVKEYSEGNTERNQKLCKFIYNKPIYGDEISPN